MNTLQKFVIASLATLVIALCSSFGVCFFVFISSVKHRLYLKTLFLGLAFSSLLCDSFLHLLPHILFEHSHDENEHDPHHLHFVDKQSNSSDAHSHRHGEHSRSKLYVFYVILISIYIIYVVQTLLNIIVNAGHTKLNHSHDYITPVVPKSDAESEDIEEKAQTEVAPQLDPQLFGMSTFAWMVTIGDAIHNIADGIAIAIAFKDGIRDGLMTSFAVGIHEFAHELGDFTLLLASGLPIAKAVIINLATSFTAFIGLYGSLLIFKDPTIQNVMLSITIGIFVYIAMSEVLPLMKQYESEQPWVIFAIYNTGIIVSFVFMSLLLLLE